MGGVTIALTAIAAAIIEPSNKLTVGVLAITAIVVSAGEMVSRLGIELSRKKGEKGDE